MQMEIDTNMLKYAKENMHKICKYMQKYEIKYAQICTNMHKICKKYAIYVGMKSICKTWRNLRRQHSPLVTA